MNLETHLNGPVDELTWKFLDERASGVAALRLANPGLQLDLAAAAPYVPHAVFHDWLFRCAERMLRAYAGYGHVEDHEGDWLFQGVALVKVSADPADASIGDIALMHIASLNTFAAIRASRPAEMGDAYAWVAEALHWATKRHMRDRRCPYSAAGLAARAAEIHGAVAQLRGEDGAEAIAEERRAQLQSLVDSWREFNADEAVKTRQRT